MKLSEELKAYLDNPEEELAKLPDLIERVAQFETEHETFVKEQSELEIEYQNRFATMQKTNRELARQIPQRSDNPNEPEEEKIPSVQEVVRAIRDQTYEERK